MAIFAMADLHLALSNPEKTMEEFGSGWTDYMELIKKNWEETVGPDDTVLMPGDSSWAMYIEKAHEDFKFINSLPGHKLIGRGNHDYWWTTVSKLEKYCAGEGFDTISFIRNNAIVIEDSVVTGTRGWKLPYESGFSAEDRKIFDREVIRLGLCLKEVDKADSEHKLRHIVMLHYPPLTRKCMSSDFSKLLEDSNTDICVYGHLHGFSHSNAFEGRKDDGTVVEYRCVAADFLRFKPLKI